MTKDQKDELASAEKTLAWLEVRSKHMAAVLLHGVQTAVRVQLLAPAEAMPAWLQAAARAVGFSGLRDKRAWVTVPKSAPANAWSRLPHVHMPPSLAHALAV